MTVLLALASFADRSGVAWPSVRALRRRAKIGSLSTVIAAIRKLEALGEVHVEERPVAGAVGGQRVRHYTLSKLLLQLVERPNSEGVTATGTEVLQSASSRSLFLNVSLNKEKARALSPSEQHEWLVQQAEQIQVDGRWKTAREGYNELLRRAIAVGLDSDHRRLKLSFRLANASG